MKLCVLFALSVALAACGGDPAGSLDEELGDAKTLEIGFNMGRLDQFGYLNDFYSKNVHGPRLCHVYTSWNVGSQPAVPADPNAPQGSRAWLTDWLQKAQGACDEVLVSFQAHTSSPTTPPTASAFQKAFADFVTSSWPYKGKWSFTPWNEPNNENGAGNGLGKVIPPDLAAEYYLTAAEVCKKHGCKVAAGDFASNGNWWHDFDWNCANDTVAPSDLCKSFSSENPQHKAASYLDRYKDYIANFADGKKSPLGRIHHMPSGFRPGYFAFHGWHDINDYLHDGAHCTSYDDCVTRVLLKSLGGSWSGAEIWDTETGVDQDGPAISDGEQACGAAFLLRSSALSPRITRVYLTRLHGGTGELFDASHKPREAAGILELRKTQVQNGHCQ